MIGDGSTFKKGTDPLGDGSTFKKGTDPLGDGSTWNQMLEFLMSSLTCDFVLVGKKSMRKHGISTSYHHNFFDFLR